MCGIPYELAEKDIQNNHILFQSSDTHIWRCGQVHHNILVILVLYCKAGLYAHIPFEQLIELHTNFHCTQINRYFRTRVLLFCQSSYSLWKNDTLSMKDQPCLKV